MDNNSPEKRFALLIDADNVSAKYLKPILDELSKYGTVTYKRIYGDWTLNLHAKWKEALLKNSITPIQQFGYTQGKNATDSAMIIDAMDILYTGSVEGFCIVSSDSDFTRLAVRLRESGRMVIGMGEQKTPVPFRTACDVFTILELLMPDQRGDRKGRKGKTDDPTPIPAASATRHEIEQAVVDIISSNINNDKATGLGEIGSRLLKMYPDFDVRSYGTRQISKLLSGFSSVVLNKTGFNISVELAEGVEPGSELTFEGEDESDEANAAASTAAATTPDTASPAEDESTTPEGETSGRRRRRRGGRGRHKVTNEENANADETTAEPAESAEESTEAEPEVPAEAQPEPAPAPEPEAPAEPEATPAEPEPAPEEPSEPEPRPKAKRTRKRVTKKAEAVEVQPEPAPEAPAEPETAPAEPAPEEPSEPEPKPKAKRTRKRVTKKAEPEAPAEPEPAPEPDPNATVAAFIRETVAAAPADGITVAALGRKVRNKFRNFKLKEQGFRSFRVYLDTVSGVRTEKGEHDYVAYLK